MERGDQAWAMNDIMSEYQLVPVKLLITGPDNAYHFQTQVRVRQPETVRTRYKHKVG